MEEKMKKIYQKARYGRHKMAGICVIIYFLMMGVISLIYGNPFPYREKVLLWEFWQGGWITTHGYLLILCAAMGLVVAMAAAVLGIKKDFKEIDNILLKECNTEKYLRIMSESLSYGKGVTLKGLQKDVFLLVQKKYVLALMAELRLEEAADYLTEKWEGSRKSGAYRQILLNYRLLKGYYEKDLEAFQETMEQLGKRAKNNKLLKAEEQMLRREYRQAENLLQGYRENIPYYEVIRRYLLGTCMECMRKFAQMEEHMRYVADRGNTMPCAVQARDRLNDRR